MNPLRLVHSAAPTRPTTPVTRIHLQTVEQSPCPCRDPGCRAQTLFAEGRRDYKEAGLRCLARCQANPGDIREHEDGTWQEMTSTRGWMPVAVVTLDGLDLDNEKVGSISYAVRELPGGIDVRPLPNQPITEQDAEHYQDAARGQWELERSL